MKITQIALLAITLTAGFAVNAQETTGRKSDNKIEPIGTMKVVSLSELSASPEQIAKDKTQDLKSKVKLTEEQEISVNNLFLKIENRKASLTNLSQDEKSKALKELQSVEDRELNSILAPSQQKINSESKTTTKTATNM